jgi:aryl-alcohol dehydrogenase-like predicted oxidoreductase
MPPRPLGTSGLKVSPIGLGLAALGRPGYINLGHAADLGPQRDVEAMRTHAHAVLDEAWRLGIRYYDAARSYGLAESFLASWLRDRRISPDDVTVGSKWGYTYTADWRVDAERHEVKDHTVATLRRQTVESQDELGDHLRLYQIHSATLESGVLDDPEVLRELARLKATGWRVGLSTSGPRQPETIRGAVAVEVDGSRLFDTVQATWNLLEPSAGQALSEAHAAGLGVIVKEALANGRLTSRNPDPESRPRLEQFARDSDTTIDALALATALAQPWASVVLSGASTVEQLRSNVQALEVSDIPDFADLAERPEVYWARRSRLAWN